MQNKTSFLDIHLLKDKKQAKLSAVDEETREKAVTRVVIVNITIHLDSVTPVDVQYDFTSPSVVLI